MTPLVSVGMSVRNGESTLSMAVQSILHQHFGDWELIIFDDGSTDGTPDLVRSFKDPRIRYLREDENRGLAVRLNQILETAQGRYFARMDADDISYPDRLQKQYSFLSQNPTIDLIGTPVVVFRQDGTAIGAKNSNRVHEDICRTPWLGIRLYHPTWMGKTEWFRKNRYDPFFRKAQDHELLIRTYRTSTFACIDEYLLGYREEPLSLRKLLLTRCYVAYSYVRETFHQWNPKLLLGLFCESGKALVDLLASGSQKGFLNNRAKPIDSSALGPWNSVWSSMKSRDLKAGP